MIGTRRIVLPIPYSPKIFQNVVLLRPDSTEGFDSGMVHRPIRTVRLAGRTREDDSSGMYDFKSRFRKSKMLCFAGLTPVAKVDHATGESAGKVVLSLRYDPSAARRLRFGSLPSAMNRSARPGSKPSRPRNISFFTFARRYPWRPRTIVHSIRNGQVTIETMARKRAVSNARKEPRNAKPAPGPMYISEVYLR